MTNPPEKCQGKFCFVNKKAAEGVASRSRERREKRISPYHCRECGCWHVGQRLGKQFIKHKMKPKPVIENDE